MLDEKDSINKINRFVSEPPGAWRMTDRTEIEEYYDKDAITPKRPSDRERSSWIKSPWRKYTRLR